MTRWIAQSLVGTTCATTILPWPINKPWWFKVGGIAKVATALIVEVFASAAGAVLYWLAIGAALSLRTFAAANRWVVRWDGWMRRIPADLRLAVSYTLCVGLQQAPTP